MQLANCAKGALVGLSLIESFLRILPLFLTYFLFIFDLPLTAVGVGAMTDLLLPTGWDHWA